MSTAEQLDWEARFRRPAAFAAFAAGVLLLASLIVRQSIFDDRPGILSGPDSLLSLNESPGTLIAAAALQAVATLLLTLVFLYLFRATAHRTPGLPRWFVYLIFVGPALFAIAQIVGAFDEIDLAERFADGSYSFEDADPDENPDLTQCPAIRGELGDACADELIRDNRESPNGLAVFAGLAGPILVAFMFVMLPLRARRAGLMSPFLSILGVLAGVLLVLPIFPPVILQAFWLGAVGALFLGNWPGGRGPAWESGEAEPWPSSAQRRGLMGREASATKDEAEVEPDETEPVPDEDVETEPVPERPSSRKRKRKRSP